MLKPIFKWAGGKSRMKSKYGELIYPKETPKYFFDMFTGAMAVSIWMADRYPNIEILANDYNSGIVNIYKCIQIDLEAFIERVKEFESIYIPLKTKEARKEFFMEQRRIHAFEYENMSNTEEAGLLYSLMKTGFNGIWQENLNTGGRYGTPLGLGNEKTHIFNEDQVRKFHIFSKQVTFLNKDFKQVNNYINKGCFVYMDPPYRDCNTVYSKKNPFTDNEQLELCNIMNYADDENAYVAMSNKYHFDRFFEDKLSNSFNVETYDVKYTAGRKGTSDKVSECLIRNF